MDVEIYAYATTIDCKQLPEHATVYVLAERPQDRVGDTMLEYQEVQNEG